jgi:hypothetical protein
MATATIGKEQNSLNSDLLAKGLPSSIIETFASAFHPLKRSETILICCGEDVHGLDGALKKLEKQGVLNENDYELRRSNSWSGAKTIIPSGTGAVLLTGNIDSITATKLRKASKEASVQCYNPVLTGGFLKYALAYLSAYKEGHAEPPRTIAATAGVTYPPASALQPDNSPEKTQEPTAAATKPEEPIFDPTETFGKLEDFAARTLDVQNAILEVLDYRTTTETRISELLGQIEERDMQILNLIQQNSVLAKTCSTLEYEKNSLTQEKQTTTANLASERALTASLRQQKEQLEATLKEAQTKLERIRLQFT